MKKQKQRISQPDNKISVTASPSLKKRILVIDDDPGICDIFCIILKKAGYEVEIKTNGEELMKNNFTIPHLFLIDKQLRSGTNGLEICSHLKKQKVTRNIPVIMLSASPDIGTLSKKAGADTFIEKPFEISYLLKLVNYYARKKSTETLDII